MPDETYCTLSAGTINLVLLAIVSPSEPPIFFFSTLFLSLSSDEAEDCNWEVRSVDGIYSAIDPSNCNNHKVSGRVSENENGWLPFET